MVFFKDISPLFQHSVYISLRLLKLLSNIEIYCFIFVIIHIDDDEKDKNHGDKVGTNTKFQSQYEVDVNLSSSCKTICWKVKKKMV